MAPSETDGSVASNEPDDQALVAAARSGDRTAFRILVRRYERRIYAVAYGLLRNQEDALDVVQEAFVKVHRYLANFEGSSSFYTWLYRIVANLAIDQIRRGRRGRELEFDETVHKETDADGGGGLLQPLRLGDPAQAVHDREILDAVRSSLDELSDKHRSVLVMRELQGMSYADMASAMGCSKGTIMSRLFHARRNMQRLLQERLGREAAAAREHGTADDLEPEASPS